MASGIISSNGVKLLWTNPSPSSSFASQTIALDLSSYNAVVVLPKFANTSGDYRKGVVLPKGFTITAFEPDTGGRYIARTMRMTDTGVFFDTGSNNGTNSNAHFVPCFIYGIK